MNFVSRKHALKEGLEYYYTGKPCKNSHVAQRNTVNRHCLECIKMWNRREWVDRKEINNWKRRVKSRRGVLPSSHRGFINKKHFLAYSRAQHFYNTRYRPDIAQATPKWADMDAIKHIYLNRPEGYEVDHIIPLKGKNICGLHIVSNLQYLPASDNRRKHAKFEVIFE